MPCITDGHRRDLPESQYGSIKFWGWGKFCHTSGAFNFHPFMTCDQKPKPKITVCLFRLMFSFNLRLLFNSKGATHACSRWNRVKFMKFFLTGLIYRQYTTTCTHYFKSCFIISTRVRLFKISGFAFFSRPLLQTIWEFEYFPRCTCIAIEL